MAQSAKNPPAMQKTWVQLLVHEDLLEKEMATHSSILAWKIPWMEEPGRLQSVGSQGVTSPYFTLAYGNKMSSLSVLSFMCLVYRRLCF